MGTLRTKASKREINSSTSKKPHIVCTVKVFTPLSAAHVCKVPTGQTQDYVNFQPPPQKADISLCFWQRWKYFAPIFPLSF
jgi:hypothetical protein